MGWEFPEPFTIVTASLLLSLLFTLAALFGFCQIAVDHIVKKVTQAVINAKKQGE